MHLIYVDEAGNTGNRADPDQPEHLIAALFVDEKKVREAETAIKNVAVRHFGNAPLGRFEFHGYEIRGGKGFFKGLAVERRIELMKELLALPRLLSIERWPGLFGQIWSSAKWISCRFLSRYADGWPHAGRA